MKLTLPIGPRALAKKVWAQVRGNWLWIWAVLPYVVLCFVVFWLHNVSERQLRVDAKVQATADSGYLACTQSIPVLKKLTKFVEGVNELGENSVTNAKQALDATPEDSVMYPSRHSAFIRNRAAYRKISKVKKLPVPTEESCVAQRDAVLSGNLDLPPEP